MVYFFIMIVAELVHIVYEGNAKKENIKEHLGSYQWSHSNILQCNDSSHSALIYDISVHFRSIIYDWRDQELVHIIYLFIIIWHEVQVVCTMGFARLSTKQFVYLHFSYHWTKVYVRKMNLYLLIFIILCLYIFIFLIIFFVSLFAVYMFTNNLLWEKWLIVVN